MSASPLTNVKNRLIFGTSWLIWTSLYFKMLHVDFEVRWDAAFIDALVSNGLLALLCLLVMINLRFYNPRKGKFIHLMALCLGISGIWSAIIRFGLPFLLPSDSDYFTTLERSMPIRFDMAFLIISCCALVSTLWYSQEEQHENEQRKIDAEKLAREAELFKLRQQLQPHFLFNSLNSISALAASQPQQARNMIQQLSDFLRGTLKKEDHQQVNWKEELQYLNLYLEIEKVRFGHRLSTEIVSSVETDDMILPAMILQPLVENAIKFGLYDTTESVVISIYARKENNYLFVTVRNPFDEETSRPGTGFGLSSVQRRLYLLFARNDLLECNAANNVYTTTIKIPQP
ncbi:MAG: histidine kinase [Chitinophagaceae bacterium]|nr:histidine kinase [Chitinophagaceae bacterium]